MSGDFSPEDLLKFSRRSRILLSRCLDFILENLRQLDKICMFALPVSESEAPGYFSVIKTPISLQEMSKNIRKNSYSSIFDLLRDATILYTNALLYNLPNTVHYQMAEKCFKEATKLFCKRNCRKTLERHLKNSDKITEEMLGFHNEDFVFKISRNAIFDSDMSADNKRSFSTLPESDLDKSIDSNRKKMKIDDDDDNDEKSPVSTLSDLNTSDTNDKMVNVKLNFLILNEFRDKKHQETAKCDERQVEESWGFTKVGDQKFLKYFEGHQLGTSFAPKYESLAGKFPSGQIKDLVSHFGTTLDCKKSNLNLNEFNEPFLPKDSELNATYLNRSYNRIIYKSIASNFSEGSLDFSVGKIRTKNDEVSRESQLILNLLKLSDIIEKKNSFKPNVLISYPELDHEQILLTNNIKNELKSIILRSGAKPKDFVSPDVLKSLLEN